MRMVSGRLGSFAILLLPACKAPPSPAPVAPDPAQPASEPEPRPVEQTAAMNPQRGEGWTDQKVEEVRARLYRKMEPTNEKDDARMRRFYDCVVDDVAAGPYEGFGDRVVDASFTCSFGTLHELARDPDGGIQSCVEQMGANLPGGHPARRCACVAAIPAGTPLTDLEDLVNRCWEAPVEDLPRVPE